MCFCWCVKLQNARCNDKDLYAFYLCCKSRILVPDDDPQATKHVAFTDDIRTLLCLTVTNMPVLLAQHNGTKSIKIISSPPRLSASDGVNINLIGFQTSYVSELPACSH